METERITLSQRERDRLKVLHEVQQRHLSQVAAAERLKITDRQVRAEGVFYERGRSIPPITLGLRSERFNWRALFVAARRAVADLRWGRN